MAKNNIKTKSGFTIIEVVLVLAIAGLIFLMVFVALPNMQRSQRDTQRRNDYAALSANMTSYMTNNNGSLPADGTLTASKYLNSTGKDPNGYTYTLTVKACDNTTNCAGTAGNTSSYKLSANNGAAATTVWVVKKATCNNGYLKYSTSSRAFAVYGQLESGNGTYCQSNS